MRNIYSAVILTVTLMVTLGSITLSFAANGEYELELSGNYASTSSKDLESGWGISTGAGKEIMGLQFIKGSTLQIRSDISYQHWGKKDVKVSRIPVSVGTRLFVPVESLKKIRFYCEGNLEVSFDQRKDTETIPIFGTAPRSINSTEFGVSPAFGIEYAILPKLVAGTGLKYHIIDGKYLTVSAGLGYKF